MVLGRVFEAELWLPHKATVPRPSLKPITFPRRANALNVMPRTRVSTIKTFQYFLVICMVPKTSTTCVAIFLRIYIFLLELSGKFFLAVYGGLYICRRNGSDLLIIPERHKFFSHYFFSLCLFITLIAYLSLCLFQHSNFFASAEHDRPCLTLIC